MIRPSKHKDLQNFHFFAIKIYNDFPKMINITNDQKKSRFPRFLKQIGIHLESIQNENNQVQSLSLEESNLRPKDSHTISYTNTKSYTPVITKKKVFTKQELHFFLTKRFSSYKI